jgi:hypothetical protein
MLVMVCNQGPQWSSTLKLGDVNRVGSTLDPNMPLSTTGGVNDGLFLSILCINPPPTRALYNTAVKKDDGATI